MPPENTDQQQFDEDVNRVGKRIIAIAAGVGIVAALIMSTIALTRNSNGSNVTIAPRVTAVAPATATAPRTASIMIDHVLRGCHTLDVNGSAKLSPTATIHLAAGGSLNVQNNDVMPHELVVASGPQPAFVTPKMSHMGAKSTVMFSQAGTYKLTTKPGEDYMKGVKTIGADNKLSITVVVA